MSKGITCLHIADLHFGVETYGLTNPQTGLNTRLEDFSDSLGQAVEFAIDQTVDLVVFAGDAYKRNSPSPTEQRELVKHFCRLADANIPVIMISGNHDIPVMHGKASSIDIFRRLRPEQIQVYINHPTLGDLSPPIIETRNGPIAVCCLPYISPSYLRYTYHQDNMNEEQLQQAYQAFYNETIQAMAQLCPDNVPKILLAHLTVQGARLGGYRGSALITDEVQILPADLANAGYDYVALGHIHQHQNLSPLPHIPIIYSGSIDRVDFGEMEEEKGFVLTHVEKGGSEYEFKPVNVRPFCAIHVESEAGDDLTQRILNAIELHDIEGAVVRLSYVADDAEVQSLDMKRIHQALKPAQSKVGFHRIPRETQARRRSVSLSGEVTLIDALNTYIRENEDLKIDGPQLVEKANDIARSVQMKL